MNRSSRRLPKSLAFLAAALLLPGHILADEAPGPRYTYLGAGYEWQDSKCGVTTQQRIEGYNVEASLGLFDFLHVLGEYSDGDTDFDDARTGAQKELDFKCYKIGAGLSYGITDSVDIVLRGYYVDVELDNPRASGTRDEDGFEPELLARIMASEKTEVYVGMTYTDLGDDLTDTQVRLGLVHNLTPLIALRFGGTGFDDDTGFDAGIRIYLGDSIF